MNSLRKNLSQNKDSIIQLIIKLSLLLPFGVLEFLFIYFGWGLTLKDFQTTLIFLNITIAIFAINFSFLEYQFSPYKTLIYPLGRTHRIFSILLVSFALIPILSIVMFKDYIGFVSLIFLPIIAYSSIILGFSVSKECSGISLLKRNSSEKKFIKFLPKLVMDYDNSIYEYEKIKLSSPENTPMHEWFGSKSFQPKIRHDDPIDLSINISLIAFENNDFKTFNYAIQQILNYYSILENFKISTSQVDKYKIKSSIRNYITRKLKHVALYCVSNDKSSSFIFHLQEKFANFVKMQAYNKKQIQDDTVHVFNFMIILGKSLLDKNLREDALLTIDIARQIAQSGIDNPRKIKMDGKEEEDPTFEGNLGIYVRYITQMGQHSIKLKNSDYLYRCLDCLGWLGCSAIRNQKIRITTVCLQGLVQLGRESRAADMTCFWSHCALKPEDHAEERIRWILTWVRPSKDPSKKPFGRAQVERALSRFYGLECNIEIKKQNDKFEFKINKSDKKYTETIVSNGQTRIIDYSNPKTLDEFDLH